MALTLTTEAWPTRRRLLVGYEVLIGFGALVIMLTHLGGLAHAATRPGLWVTLGLAAVAGMIAFVETPPSGGAGLVRSPTIGLTFAVLLCLGLGPAIVVQAVARALVAWRLRLPTRHALESIAQLTLAFGAAALVLWFGHPGSFQRDAPTNVLTDAFLVLAAAAAWLATFGLVGLVGTKLRMDGASSRQATGALANQLLYKAALLLLSPVLAVAAHTNVWLLPLVFVPLFAVQRMARLSAERDRAARIDPLTKLANRSGLTAGFEDLGTGHGRRDRRRLLRGSDQYRATLLLLDLDHFKDVNDALGHDVGDQLLVAVAERIAGASPAEATVARLGGDEFAIVTATRTHDEATRLAQGVARAIAEPISLDRLRIDVTASIGVARHTDERDQFADLMRHADMAMYDAKRRGDSIAGYAQRPDGGGSRRLSLLTDLRDALVAGDRDQITLHYQPQVSLADGQVEGVEALLRWRHPAFGPISTQELLSVVEHSSVMRLLTMRVIEDVVGQVAEWNARGITLRASLNISARDLYSDDLVSHLAAQLARHRVNPGQIQVEITESALLADPTRAQATVTRLAALGIAIALDDFGTGYSSLQHLRKLPVTEIKIDGGFVAGMADNRDDAAIVGSTVEMARSLGIRTVAEGVETEYTRRLLADAGCTLAQGWLAARPMPAAELTRWLTARSDRRWPDGNSRENGQRSPVRSSGVRGVDHVRPAVAADRAG